MLFENEGVKINVPTITNIFRIESTLKENELITLDSDEGNVYLGINEDKIKNKKKNIETKKITITKQEQITSSVQTYISLSSNLALPSELINIDGGYVDSLDQLKKFATIFSKKPVIADLKFNSEKNNNFISNIKQIHKLRNQDNLRNIWISISNINRDKDLSDAKKTLSSNKFRRSSTFKVMLTINNSTAIFGIEELLDVDVDGVILDIEKLIINMFGLYDVTLLEDKALLKSLEILFKAIQKHRIPFYLKGELPLNIIKKYLDQGIYALILNPLKLHETRSFIAKNELLGLKKRKRKK